MEWPTEIGTMCFLRYNEKTLFFYRERGAEDIHNGWYVPPGGHFDRGERGIDCVIREFGEETGLRINNPKLRQIVMFFNKDRILGGKKDRPDWYVEVYEANQFEGVLKPERKGEKLIWVEDKNVGSLKIYECDRKIFDLLSSEGVYEVVVKYDGEKLEKFDSRRVA